jgi:hypothetical protein
MSKTTSKYVKDHVSGFGTQVKKATAKHFAINNALIVRAALGNEKACKQIADMGQVGERLSLAMPIIQQNALNYMQGIKEYNTALAAIYKAGGDGSLVIDKAGSELSLANTKYQNKLEEYKTKLFADLRAEEERHNDAMDVIELKAWVDSHVREVDAIAGQESISNAPYLKQLQADRELSKQRMQHWLQHGSDSNTSLIPEKNYITNPIQKFWQEVRGIFH